jgi:hypothetical protein
VPVGKTMTAPAHSKEAIDPHMPNNYRRFWAQTREQCGRLPEDKSAVAHDLVARAGRVAGIA